MWLTPLVGSGTAAHLVALALLALGLALLGFARALLLLTLHAQPLLLLLLHPQVLSIEEVLVVFHRALQRAHLPTDDVWVERHLEARELALCDGLVGECRQVDEPVARRRAHAQRRIGHALAELVRARTALHLEHVRGVKGARAVDELRTPDETALGDLAESGVGLLRFPNL